MSLILRTDPGDEGEEEEGGEGGLVTVGDAVGCCVGSSLVSWFSSLLSVWEGIWDRLGEDGRDLIVSGSEEKLSHDPRVMRDWRRL